MMIEKHALEMKANKSTYNRFLLIVAGMGGLLYGIDIGIITPALDNLGKTMAMTEENKSVIVAAVLGGSMFASITAGFFADLLGRKLGRTQKLSPGSFCPWRRSRFPPSWTCRSVPWKCGT